MYKLLNLLENLGIKSALYIHQDDVNVYIIDFIDGNGSI